MFARARDSIAPELEGKRAMSGDVNDTNNLSTLLAAWASRDVGGLISSAAFALGGREADLARAMGVSRATLSSWKARGAIPSPQMAWLVERLPAEVLRRIAPAPGDDFRHAGVSTALHLLRMTEFNPFDLRGLSIADLVEVSAVHMGGFVRLGHFILSGWPLGSFDSDDPYDAQAARLLGRLTKEVAPCIFPGALVSQ
jgi:hypothetical protein